MMWMPLPRGIKNQGEPKQQLIRFGSMTPLFFDVSPSFEDAHEGGDSFDTNRQTDAWFSFRPTIPIMGRLKTLQQGLEGATDNNNCFKQTVFVI